LPPVVEFIPEPDTDELGSVSGLGSEDGEHMAGYMTVGEMRGAP
jgi:hypothetical protein